MKSTNKITELNREMAALQKNEQRWQKISNYFLFLGLAGALTMIVGLIIYLGHKFEMGFVMVYSGALFASLSLITVLALMNPYKSSAVRLEQLKAQLEPFFKEFGLDSKQVEDMSDSAIHHHVLDKLIDSASLTVAADQLANSCKPFLNKPYAKNIIRIVSPAAVEAAKSHNEKHKRMIMAAEPLGIVQNKNSQEIFAIAWKDASKIELVIS